MKMKQCPICNSTKQGELLSLTCGNMDKSFLYDPAIILCCSECGHIFNNVSFKDERNIFKYYNNEYSPINLHTPNKNGDTPGSSGRNSLIRYSFLYGFMKTYAKPTDKILDIGCASGGFLHYLHTNGYENLYGIDLSDIYIQEAKKKEYLNIKKGTAESIPYPLEFFDFLIADQVVEHLFDPQKIFMEAKKVIKKDGFFCISVPNADFYDKYNFFDFYWFLLREHVQHFDIQHLSMIAGKYGFALRMATNSTNPMTSNKTILPNVSMIFQYTGNKINVEFENFNLKSRTIFYIKNSREKLREKRKIISKLKDPLYVWGIGREFLYLYNNAGLNKCFIAGLIDDTPHKQQKMTFNNKKMNGREFLENATLPVLITATAHTEKLKQELKKLNFRGEIIEL